ncbi:uncharacterized protein BcabD6B2_16500 [Babesia caballi]|uniref:Uncharacterized protein n=1 Tax=Babesia caballi TaxID=5871 RepID=A0AAV4LQR1_BABCB|nr:hypothetical protein BcabD6B2_16500 [Babesia caballi]
MHSIHLSKRNRQRRPQVLNQLRATHVPLEVVDQHAQVRVERLQAANRPEAADEVARLAVLAQIQNVEPPPLQLRQQLAHRRLSHSRLPHQQHRLTVLQRREQQRQQPVRRPLKPQISLALEELAHAQPACPHEPAQRRVHREVHHQLLRLRRLRQQAAPLQHAPHHFLVGRVAQLLRDDAPPVVRQPRVVVPHPVRPLYQVAQRYQHRVPLERHRVHRARLQALERRHDLLRPRQRDCAALVQHLLQVRRAQPLDVQLHEPVAKRLRQLLPPAVDAVRRVLRGEYHELRVRPDRLARLRHVDFPVVIQYPVKRLQNLARRQVELVQDNPVPLLHRRHDRPVVELELARRRVEHELPQVLRQVCVLVVVDAHAPVPRQRAQVLHHRGLARRRGSLQQHRHPQPAQHSAESPQALGYVRRHDKVLLLSNSLPAAADPVPLDADVVHALLEGAALPLRRRRQQRLHFGEGRFPQRRGEARQRSVHERLTAVLHCPVTPPHHVMHVIQRAHQVSQRERRRLEAPVLQCALPAQLPRLEVKVAQLRAWHAAVVRVRPHHHGNVLHRLDLIHEYLRHLAAEVRRQLLLAAGEGHEVSLADYRRVHAGEEPKVFVDVHHAAPALVQFKLGRRS